MKLFRAICISILGIISIQIHAQTSTCLNAINQINNDSLIAKLRLIIGLDSVKSSSGNYLISSRYESHPGNALAENYLAQQLADYGYSIQNIPFSITGRNIIGYKPGSVNPKTAYIFSAHFDCVGNASQPFQGADDNGSGVAAVLEAARVLKDLSFPYTIIFALWDEEEQGLIGSKAFAPDGPDGYWDINLMMNLDMIAWDGNDDQKALIHSNNIGRSQAYANKLYQFNDSFQTGLSPFIKNPGTDASDHKSFWLTGTTAIGFTEDYDNDISPHWHKFSDSLTNLKLPYFYQMTRLAIGGFCEFAYRPQLVGIPFPTAPSQLCVYPNPVTGNLKIDGLTGNENIQIMSLNGMILHKVSNTNIIDFSDFPNGLYFISICKLNEVPQWFKIIKSSSN